MKIETLIFETGMGRVMTFFGHPLYFLTDKEKKDFDTVGSSGKLNGVKTNYRDYLNSLGKGNFEVSQTKFDDGSFSEGFTLVRVTE